jgi:hypothetical protein
MFLQAMNTRLNDAKEHLAYTVQQKENLEADHQEVFMAYKCYKEAKEPEIAKLKDNAGKHSVETGKLKDKIKELEEWVKTAEHEAKISSDNLVHSEEKVAQQEVEIKELRAKLAAVPPTETRTATPGRRSQITVNTASTKTTLKGGSQEKETDSPLAPVAEKKAPRQIVKKEKKTPASAIPIALQSEPAVATPTPTLTTVTKTPPVAAANAPTPTPFAFPIPDKPAAKPKPAAPSVVKSTDGGNSSGDAGADEPKPKPPPPVVVVSEAELALFEPKTIKKPKLKKYVVEARLRGKKAAPKVEEEGGKPREAGTSSSSITTVTATAAPGAIAIVADNKEVSGKAEKGPVLKERSAEKAPLVVTAETHTTAEPVTLAAPAKSKTFSPANTAAAPKTAPVPSEAEADSDEEDDRDTIGSPKASLASAPSTAIGIGRNAVVPVTLVSRSIAVKQDDNDDDEEENKSNADSEQDSENISTAGSGSDCSDDDSDTDSDEEEGEIDCRAEMAKTWRMLTTHISEALQENMEGEMVNTVRQVLTPVTITMSSMVAAAVMVSAL